MNAETAYTAALAILRDCWTAGERADVVLHTDSRLLAGQYDGTLGCAASDLVPLLSRLRKAGAAFRSLAIVYADYDHDESQQRVDALIAHLAAHPPADWMAWEQTQERIQQACAVGDMGRVRALCEVTA